MKKNRNEQKVEQQGFKLYILHDIDRGCTVAYIKNDMGIIARGIAICSEKDQFRRKTGRHIAVGRAIQALERDLVTGEIIPGRWYPQMAKVSRYWTIADKYGSHKWITADRC